ncbi:MAG: PAS domain-containing protein, partial [Deltaproteobacteria bacterium]|nr:PAS domain-containing protein [Deltaproteobacteria bacterium]
MGWFDLTRHGGSGSFLVNWSGLSKLSAAAAIPYHTGQYGASPRGFGFVAIGAELADFHLPSNAMKGKLDELFAQSAEAHEKLLGEAGDAITRNLRDSTIALFLATALMTVVVVLVAIWLASVFTRSITRLIEGISRFRLGERHFRFHASIKDELGTLADSFDELADSLVESVGDPLVIIDMRLYVRYMNDAALHLAGASSLADVLGKPYAQFSVYPPGSAHCPINCLQEGREAEVRFHESSGGYFKGTAKYLLDPKTGERIGYIVVTTDYTSIVAEQLEHEKQRAMLHTIFVASPDLMWFKDGEGRYLAANPRFESFLGKRREEYLGHTADKVYRSDMPAHFDMADAAVAAGRTPLYAEETLIFADGHMEVADVVITPVFSGAEEYQGVLGVARDVSRRVQVERELRDAQLELEKTAELANKANMAKSAFLALMSHEIRTPLGAIIGMTNIIKRKLGDPRKSLEDIRPHVLQVEASSQHLLALLNDLLDISKIEAGKLELSEDNLNIRALLDNVVAMIEPRCQENALNFDVRIGDIEPVVYRCDGLRLRQALINFLGNAVKFTPSPGTVGLCVDQLEYKDGKSLMRFIISDDGIGISEKALGSLFEPFEQAHAGIAKKYGGTGLGMSISRSIIEMMGGAIEVQSEEGKGSTFTFGVWLDEAQAQPGDGDAPSAQALSLTGKHALLVDDIELNRMIVMELF